jgi:hypothetical protein
MNCTSSIISRSAARSCCLKRIVSFPQGRDEAEHELLGRHQHDLRARPVAPIFVADGVQQVGLAAPGAAMDEERVEGDIVRAGERAGGVEGNLIGLADHERIETKARIERRREQLVARLLRRGLRLCCRDRLGGRGADGLDACAGADQHLTDRRDRGLPGERKPVGEVGMNPIRHELGREFQLDLAGLGAESAERDRAQPAIEGACAAIAAKTGPDRIPSRGDRLGHGGIGKQSYTTGRRLAHARTPLFLGPIVKQCPDAKQTLPSRQTPPGAANTRTSFCCFNPPEREFAAEEPVC